MLLARRIWNWCRRFRYRCGYGVHSPSDFFLITSVMYERLPYYAYQELEKCSLPESLPHYRTKVNRLLFRLVNYFRPLSLVDVGPGNGDALRYMRSARSSMAVVALEGSDRDDTLHRLDKELKKLGKVDFLHIGFTPYYKEVFELVYPYLHGQSCVVAGDIHASDGRKAWWKERMSDERVRITFDLYDIGLMLFEEKRFKQNYTVNFF